jgi:long-subunit acyl-CoA synthetase (AMP-forming)
MSVNFARNYDLKASSIVERFGVVRPTLFLGVPRVWEKIQAKMIQKKQAAIESGEMSAFAQSVSEWGKKCGREYARASQMGGSGSKDIMYGVADALVHKKVKGLLGLDKCKYAFTGAAPISVETLEYFASVGIWINEVYGMSECTGAATWSTDAAHVWGSCGWAVPGVEVKVFATSKGGTNSECPPADDLTQPTEAQQGEICYRGRNIMMGYLANPDMGKEHMDEIARKTVSGSK